jgi:hypothetical protein
MEVGQETSDSDAKSGPPPLLFYADGYRFPDVYHRCACRWGDRWPEGAHPQTH